MFTFFLTCHGILCIVQNMKNDPTEIDPRKLGLVYYGGRHEKLRYFTGYKFILTKCGHDNLEITFLDGTAGIIEAEFAKGKKGEESRWYEAKESVRRFPEINSMEGIL